MVRACTAAALLILVGWLFVPAISATTPPATNQHAFVWDQDAVWDRLEQEFNTSREDGCIATTARIDRGLQALAKNVEWLERGSHAASDARFDTLEDTLFAVAPLLAACPAQVPGFIDQINRLRTALKRNSQQWDITDSRARQRVYRLLYGARMATEEVVLQRAAAGIPALVLGADVASETPSIMVKGLRVHSGDILVSRGGAPVSAFIARGNDYPGNFSHIALLHISEQGEVNVVEAQIEEGVTVSSLDEYLTDKKLRLMVLRLDPTLASMQDDPLLPHRAATAALREVRERHVPYDFAMYYQDPSKKFCSEVASAAYSAEGVNLWDGLTTMSSHGTRAWLAALGVEQFETHGPSDLEYDPQLVVVAEWRDPETLFDDHVDNAVIDALLEGAERGDTVDYAYRYLPIARAMKAYSALLNAAGKLGPVPEGMSATTALRSQWLDSRHADLKARVIEQVQLFQDANGYAPPYWQLVAMARKTLAEAEG